MARLCATQGGELQGGRVRCWGTGLAGRLGYPELVDIGDDETPASAGDVPCLLPPPLARWVSFRRVSATEKRRRVFDPGINGADRSACVLAVPRLMPRLQASLCPAHGPQEKDSHTS